MQIALGTHYKGLPKIHKGICLEAGTLAIYSNGNQGNVTELWLAHQVTASPKIYGSMAKGFVHGIETGATAENTSTISQGLTKDLTQHNACVFHQVVLIHL